MTEIPEHLLKRSKERRAAIGGGDAPAERERARGRGGRGRPRRPPAVAPAAAAAAVPEPAPVPEPVRPEVAAALSRRKIPFWAMPVLAALPLWAYVYQATLEPPPSRRAHARSRPGGEVYVSSACAGCHGAGGGGGASVPRSTGVLETWPDYRDHMMWVRLGNAGWSTSGEHTTAPTRSRQRRRHARPPDASPTRSWPRSCSTSGSRSAAWRRRARSTSSCSPIAEGELTFAEAGLGDAVRPRSGVTEDDLAAG